MVAAGFGDGIEHQSPSLAILCVVIVGEHLEFLDLIYRSAYTPKPPGDQLVGNVSAINVIKIAAKVDGAGAYRLGADAAGIELYARRGQRQLGVIIRTSGGCCKSRQPFHIKIGYRGRNISFSSLNQWGFSRHFNRLGSAGHPQVKTQGPLITYI